MLREDVAREEAAHACAAVRAGQRIVSVTLDPPCCRLENTDSYRLADAVVRIAGPLAVGVWPPARSEALPVLVDDLTASELICDAIAVEHGLNAKQLLATAEDRAAALLQDPHFIADVDRLAQRLLIDGQISGPDAERLLAGDLGKSFPKDTNQAPWWDEATPPVVAPWRAVASSC